MGVEAVSILIGVFSILAVLVTILIFMIKINTDNVHQTLDIKGLRDDFEEHKRADRTYKMDSYKDKIIEFQSKLKNNPEKVYSEYMYEKTFEYYDKYVELGGNSYVKKAMKLIRSRYRRDYMRDVVDED